MGEQDTDFTAESATTLREHTDEIRSALHHPDENTVKQWVLLTGNRVVVSGVLLVAVFTILIGTTAVKPLNMQDLLNETSTVTTLFSGLLSGAILLVSIVVSITSVVLSQEITDIESQQERITASIEYRKRIEGFIEEDVSPARPAEFLRVILYAIYRTTQDLDYIAEESANDDFQTHAESVVKDITTNITQARHTLGNARLGSFGVLLVGLGYNYSAQLHAARRLKQEYGATLTDEEVEVIDDLIATLKFFATGREYFKSIYYKREFAQLSNRLLYVSLPVIVFTSYILLALDANLIPDTVLFGFSPLVVFVGFAYTVALAPYVVLTAYILRATTVTLRTLAAGPFILQSGTDIEGLDWEASPDEREWEPIERRAK